MSTKTITFKPVSMVMENDKVWDFANQEILEEFITMVNKSLQIPFGDAGVGHLKEGDDYLIEDLVIYTDAESAMRDLKLLGEK